MADQPQQPGPTLAATPALATATVQITRAATGAVETYELTFTPLADEPAPDLNTQGA